MTIMIALLNVLNGLSPLAVIALLVLVLFYQAKNNKAAVDHAMTLDDVRSNDLHELPTMLETLKRIEMNQAAGLLNQAASFATIIAKLEPK